MADSFLIDGYNLIHALGLIAQPVGPQVLENARRRLLEYLKSAFGADAMRITVVFDARKAPLHVPRQLTYHGIHVCYAPGKGCADDHIETLIETHPTPRSLIVISNDNRLQQAAERRGARAWTHTLMLDFLEKKEKIAKPGAAADTDEQRSEPLSREEMEHWLKEFAPREGDTEWKEFFDMDRFD